MSVCFWPWARRPLTNRMVTAWAREVVATIPREQLADHAMTFAHAAMRSKRGGEKHRRHWEKLVACCERIQRELGYE